MQAMLFVAWLPYSRFCIACMLPDGVFVGHALVGKKDEIMCWFRLFGVEWNG